jgi:type II secretory pathway component PulJ
MLFDKQFTKRVGRVSGFSLTEILVVLVLSTILVSTLLYVMVDLMTSSQSEQARSNTNEEMKQALNYMAQELREATYVYTGQELEQSRKVDNKNLLPVKNFLPNFGANTRPIIAFWKVEPVPYNGSSDTLPSSCTSFSGYKVDECSAIRIEQRTYTLVVYIQSTDNSSGDWKGDSRIFRYQLRKYTNPTTLTATTGYVDPMVNSTFQQWPYDLNYASAQAALPTTNSSNLIPLVDFVASPTTVITNVEDKIYCPMPNVGYKVSPYGLVPTAPNTNYEPTNAKSFFACVRDAGITTAEGFNQDVTLFLRGNAKGKPGVEKDDEGWLGMLQVQTISRGVVRKTVAD